MVIKKDVLDFGLFKVGAVAKLDSLWYEMKALCNADASGPVAQPDRAAVS